MALIDAVRKACTRLGPKGWTALLKRQGLDIGMADLAAELARPLAGIDRALPGFEDFAREGRRGIEPGIPARSLLYHAFASPNVIEDVAGKRLKAFPTPAEIEAVENFVFGAQRPSIQELRTLAGGSGKLAVAVFAVEYRPAHETVHRLHADLCFSRTGVARVGNKAAAYDAGRRGFLPHRTGDKRHDFRVLPARYAAYVAVQRRGKDDSYGPMNPQSSDDGLDFWIPLHKLFAGDECLRDLDLTLAWVVEHRNTKLRRIHVETKGGWLSEAYDLDAFPFVISDGLATLSTKAVDGTGLLVPVPHPLVEEARQGGSTVTFKVPVDVDNYSSSIIIEADGANRRAPEYVHARHAVRANGKVDNLNDRRDVTGAVVAGGYRAKHYVDYTADGWIEALCPELGHDIPRRVPAYSLVTAPDFFVNTDQRELIEWTRQSVRTELRRYLWVYDPDTLNDTRLAPNLTLTDRFVKEDKTVTAIVALPRSGPAQATHARLPNSERHAHLPDAAAGLFAPGWDVSRDSTQGTPHLAMYGLGSPFPEDAKLCAALSTFWPAVAPDTARVFQPQDIETSPSPTVAPLTDAEIGIGGRAWDGTAPPRARTIKGEEVVEYASFDHADYVEAALNNKFSLAATGAIGTREYEARVLAMARAYRALGITTGDGEELIRRRASWSVLSFTKLAKRTAELLKAEKAVGEKCTLPVYRFEMFRYGKPISVPGNARRVRVQVRERALLFVDGLNVLSRRGTKNWKWTTDA